MCWWLVMTDAPKRIWAFAKKDWFNAGASTSKITSAGAKDVEYHRADLSANLVQAGYLAGLEAAGYEGAIPCYETRHVTLGDKVSETIRAMSPNPEAIAAIVARVAEWK